MDRRNRRQRWMAARYVDASSTIRRRWRRVSRARCSHYTHERKRLSPVPRFGCWFSDQTLSVFTMTTASRSLAKAQNCYVLNEGDLLHNALAIGAPCVDAESELMFRCGHRILLSQRTCGSSSGPVSGSKSEHATPRNSPRSMISSLVTLML
jgi:hypothetical protein